MSSTRHATDGKFHQSRYCSSPEFQRGLAFTCVAPVPRQILKDRPADRELVWFVQSLSHQPGGLAALAAKLIADYSDRIGTHEMLAVNKSARNYTADEVRKIRLDLPAHLRRKFPLKGETASDLSQLLCVSQSNADQVETKRSLVAYVDEACRTLDTFEEMFTGERERREQAEREEAAKYPVAYPVSALRDLCLSFAKCEQSGLEREMNELCVNPEWPWQRGGPWYFPNLVATLRDLQARMAGDESDFVMTPVAALIQEFLDYTLATGGLYLLTGPGNVGARYAARELCRRQPGRVRVFDVPATNDEASFYRGIGRALGGNFTNYKNVQIRERVSELLQSGDLALVLTSAQNLWPQKNLREAFPGRLAWLMEQTESGAAVCLISGPQFFMQKRSCEKSGWDSPEFADRIHAQTLPDELSVEDLTAISKRALPQASDDDCEVIALGAFASERYLASVDAVVKRAKYLSSRAGRNHQTEDDIADAIHFVSQSDKILQRARHQSVARLPGRNRGNAVPHETPANSVQRANITEFSPA